MAIFTAPDWREASNYPDPKKASPSRWAWEFLRRNSEYCADWEWFANRVRQKASKLPETLDYVDWYLTRTKMAGATLRAKFQTDEQHNEYFNTAARALHDDDFYYLRAFEPPREDGETLVQYKARIFAKGITSYKTCDWTHKLGEKWGIDNLAPPGMDGLPRFKAWHGGGASYPNVDFRDSLARFPESERGYWAMRWLDDLGQRLGKPELETLTVDLTMPLEAQLENALRWLSAIRESKTERGEITPVALQRYQKKQYLLYLRALDASNAGASPGDMVSVLLPHEAGGDNHAGGFAPRTKIAAWIKRATQLVERDYRFIPIAANKEARQGKSKN